MPIRERQTPVRFTPRGLCDALDSTDRFQGACTALTNLIFDQSNPEQMISRPGVIAMTDFTGATPAFITPGVVSCQITIGTRIYGMIASGLNAGREQPFCYETATNTFIAITGVKDATTTPSAQATTGAWTPPIMAVVGNSIVITHVGFAGTTGKFGVINITVPATPAWTVNDTATNALPSVPTFVANFNNRAYFVCGNTLPFSDVLVPTTRTNAGQSLTIGDTSTLTALAGAPIQTTTSGITSALYVFKEFQVWQVTGEYPSTLTLNYLSLTIGCAAPRSIAQSPFGIYFVSIGGSYIINQMGSVIPVTHGDNMESDVQMPFQNIAQPSRVAAGYLATIYRVCIDTYIFGTEVTNDYWFDEHKKRWTGPHTFTYDSVSQLGHYFILTSNVAPGKLFKSEPFPDTASVYTDNAVAFSVNMTSSFFPKSQVLSMKQVVESTIELSSAGSAVTYYITAMDESKTPIDSTFVNVVSGSGLWNSGNWGDGQIWVSATNIPQTYTIPWNIPLVFKKLGLIITAVSSSAVSIGTLFARYQDAGYTNKR